MEKKTSIFILSHYFQLQEEDTTYILDSSKFVLESYLCILFFIFSF